MTNAEYESKRRYILRKYSNGDLSEREYKQEIYGLNWEYYNEEYNATMTEEENKMLKSAICGVVSTNLYNVDFEDNDDPSEKGLGYSVTVAAPSKEIAKQLFEMTYDNATIRSIEETGDFVILPVVTLEEPTEADD